MNVNPSQFALSKENRTRVYSCADGVMTELGKFGIEIRTLDGVALDGELIKSALKLATVSKSHCEQILRLVYSNYEDCKSEQPDWLEDFEIPYDLSKEGILDYVNMWFVIESDPKTQNGLSLFVNARLDWDPEHGGLWIKLLEDAVQVVEQPFLHDDAADFVLDPEHLPMLRINLKKMQESSNAGDHKIQEACRQLESDIRKIESTAPREVIDDVEKQFEARMVKMREFQDKLQDMHKRS